MFLYDQIGKAAKGAYVAIPGINNLPPFNTYGWFESLPLPQIRLASRALKFWYLRIVADWIAPNSAAGPLESSLTPWSSARPLYEIVAVTPGARLPTEDRGTALQWAPGALDGVLAHHAGRSGQSAMKQVLDCLRAVINQSTNANMRALCETLADSRVLDYIDQLLPAIEAEFPSDRMRLAGLGRFLAFRAPLREPVKFGIALLGVTGDESDLKPLLQLAQCEEFTLFASVAIWNLTPDSERYLWDLAKRLSGWGRIHVVERLEQTQNPEIQAKPN